MRLRSAREMRGLRWARAREVACKNSGKCSANENQIVALCVASLVASCMYRAHCTPRNGGRCRCGATVYWRNAQNGDHTHHTVRRPGVRPRSTHHARETPTPREV